MITKKPEDEIKFRELLKNPARLFGWIFPLFLMLILAAGIFFVKNLDTISFNGQPVGLVDSTQLKKEVELKKGGVSAAVDLNLVKNPTPAFISKGKELFTANCKSCHGDNGMGDGPAGAALVKKPRNFHAADGWTNGRNIDQMFKTLKEGIIKNGMAAYEYIPAADRFAIISFIRTLAQFPPVTDDQLKSLDAAYNLSAGTVLPNNIPVVLAKQKLVQESVTSNDQFLRFENKINTSAETPESLLFRKSVFDLKKVFTSFVNSNAAGGADKYIADVLSNPLNSGFKPAVARCSKEEWKKIIDYIKTALM